MIRPRGAGPRPCRRCEAPPAAPCRRTPPSSSPTWSRGRSFASTTRAWTGPPSTDHMVRASRSGRATSSFPRFPMWSRSPPSWAISSGSRGARRRRGRVPRTASGWCGCSKRLPARSPEAAHPWACERQGTAAGRPPRGQGGRPHGAHRRRGSGLRRAAARAGVRACGLPRRRVRRQERDRGGAEPGALAHPGRAGAEPGGRGAGRDVRGDERSVAAQGAGRDLDLRPHAAVQDQGPRRELRARRHQLREADPTAGPARGARIHHLSGDDAGADAARAREHGAQSGERLLSRLLPRTRGPGQSRLEHAQHAQGGGGNHARVPARRRRDLPAGDRTTRRRVLHGGGRAREDPREHVPQREHRSRQRDGDRLRQARRGRAGEPGTRRHPSAATARGHGRVPRPARPGPGRGRGDAALRATHGGGAPGRRLRAHRHRSRRRGLRDGGPARAHPRGHAERAGAHGQGSAMKIAVVGTGYVGLVVGACLAETGNDVICADLDAAKIASLKRNRLPIYEPGLEPLVVRNQGQGRLEFTTDVGAAIERSDIVFIAVGTPPNEDGSADLQHVLDVSGTIGRHMNTAKIVATKSTVPVGTAAKLRTEIARHTRTTFHVCSNPEFLKEGAAVEDFMKPDRVIVGIDSDEAARVLEELYAPFVRTGNPLIFMDLLSAEMTKYAANAMLATRVSFMNQIAQLCEAVGADVSLVRKGIGADRRIGPAFLFPGPGYGGSCFPKDVKALIRTGEERAVSLDILQAVEAANERQKRVLFEKLHQHFAGKLAGTTSLPAKCWCS